jgi:hypothetical protein
MTGNKLAYLVNTHSNGAYAILEVILDPPLEGTEHEKAFLFFLRSEFKIKGDRRLFCYGIDQYDPKTEKFAKGVKDRAIFYTKGTSAKTILAGLGYQVIKSSKDIK